MPETHFLLNDQSGRGFAVTLSAAEIRERWDLAYKNNPDNLWEDCFGVWLGSASVGDTFTHREANVTFTRTQ